MHRRQHYYIQLKSVWHYIKPLVDADCWQWVSFWLKETDPPDKVVEAMGGLRRLIKTALIKIRECAMSFGPLIYRRHWLSFAVTCVALLGRLYHLIDNLLSSFKGQPLAPGHGLAPGNRQAPGSIPPLEDMGICRN